MDTLPSLPLTAQFGLLAPSVVALAWFVRYSLNQERDRTKRAENLVDELNQEIRSMHDNERQTTLPAVYASQNALTQSQAALSEATALMKKLLDALTDLYSHSIEKRKL